jgi:hypothetical protein
MVALAFRIRQTSHFSKFIVALFLACYAIALPAKSEANAPAAAAAAAAAAERADESAKQKADAESDEAK